jgi:hypothetical protein
VVQLGQPFYPTLRHVAPVRVTGPLDCNVLAVWAQNGSGGVSRTSMGDRTYAVGMPLSHFGRRTWPHAHRWTCGRIGQRSM